MSNRVPSGSAVARPELTTAITTAALGELVDHGFARLTMERVARRAGTSKATLYRRWPGKVEMVVDLISELSVPTEPPASTGSLRGDVRMLLHEQLRWLRDPTIAAILPDLLTESRRNASLAEAAERYVADPRREWARAFVRRSTSSMPVVEDDELVLDLLASPLYWRVVHDRPVDEPYLDRLADFIVDVLDPQARTRSS